MLAIDLLRGSPGEKMCCEMQSECSSRATLAPKGGGCRSVGAPLNSSSRAGSEVDPARDWLETVKMHRGPKGALGVGSSSSSSSESDSGSDRLRRTGRLAQRRGGAVAKVEVGLNLDGGGLRSGRQWRARFCEVLAENVTRQDHERVRRGV